MNNFLPGLEPGFDVKENVPEESEEDNDTGRN